MEQMEFKICVGSQGKAWFEPIKGERCLQVEFPQLELFIGEYPCDNLSDDGKCTANDDDDVFEEDEACNGPCIEYRVSEAKTGMAVGASCESKEAAVESAMRVIGKVGVDRVLEEVRMFLAREGGYAKYEYVELGSGRQAE